MTSADSNLLQEILEETEVPVRLRKTLELLKKEYAMCMLQQKIGKEVIFTFYDLVGSSISIKLRNHRQRFVGPMLKNNCWPFLNRTAI